jgi:putative tricarboxylic transport membrane protein
MVKFKFPLAPAILGVILGPIGETNLRRALMTDSDLTIFVTRPISLLFLVLALFSVIWPFFQRYRQKRQTQKISNS